MVQLTPKVLDNILSHLKETSTPLFGNMTPQQMVEHLEQLFSISFGEIKVNIFTPKERLPKWKEFLMSDLPFQPYKSPLHDGGLPPLKHTDLEEAKKHLLIAVGTFYKYYKENPGAKHANPMFGELNFKEWEKFHGKHLMHHLKQFKLIQ